MSMLKNKNNKNNNKNRNNFINVGNKDNKYDGNSYVHDNVNVNMDSNKQNVNTLNMNKVPKLHHINSMNKRNSITNDNNKCRQKQRIIPHIDIGTASKSKQ